MFNSKSFLVRKSAVIEFGNYYRFFSAAHRHETKKKHKWTHFVKLED